jgi:hypothetical protein
VSAQQISLWVETGSCAWYNGFAAYLLSLGFVEAKSDTSMFVYRRGADIIYLLLYVCCSMLMILSSQLLHQNFSGAQQQQLVATRDAS